MDGRPPEILGPSDLGPGGLGEGEEGGSALAACDLRLLVPLSCHQKVVGFVALGPRPGEEPYGSVERELLLAVGNPTVTALTYAGSVREEAERLFLVEDMAQARKVQQRILPQECLHAEGLRTAARFRPARGVAGDIYDFIPFPDGCLGVALGDVAGKGMAAALLMASLQAMLRVHADAHRREVERLASDVNRQLCTVTDSNRFASLFYGVYDPGGRTFTYVNAGHHPGLLLCASPFRSVGAEAAVLLSVPERAALVPLPSTGMVLGVLPDAVFGRETLRFEPGDLLVLYTDGLLDAVNGEGHRFGEEGLQRAVLRHRRLNPEALCEALLAEVAAFCGDVAPPDDMTLVVLRAA
ncbi:MAG: PP2C family protein-serine/threonine phosphatase [Acidobacteriota bacterium]